MFGVRLWQFITTVSLVVVPLGLVAGCGSDSEGGGGVTGVWTGTQNRAVDGTIEYDFTQNGTSISGTARITTTSGAIYTGDFTGTLNGNAVDITVTWKSPAGYGTTHFTGTLNGNQLSGNYTHTLPGGATESGTVTLARSNVTTPANIGGTYSGTAVRSDGTHQVNVTIVVTQTGHSISGTITVSDTQNGTVNGTINGTIIGNHITEGTGTVGDSTFTFDGTLNGKTFSGTWAGTGSGGTPHNGTFTFTEQ